MRRCLIAVALLAACDSATVPERLLNEMYEYRVATNSGLRVLRWPAGGTVHVYVAPDADPTRTASLENGLMHAIDVWNAAALYGEVQIEQTSELGNADAVLLFSSTLPPVNMTGCPRGSGLAVTTFCLSVQDANRLAAFPQASGGGRVKFVVTVADVVTDAELVRKLVAHELGHVLGIGQHSPRSADLMYGNTLTTAFPSVADRATLQLLYHTQPDITP